MKEKTFDDYMKSINENLDKASKIQAEASKEAKKWQAAHEKRLAKYEKEAKIRNAEFDKKMKEIQKAWGDHTNNIGYIAEEYFYNSFKKGKKKFFGEKFDDIQKRVKPIGYGCNDEYDIVLINGKSIGIIEVKHKAHKNDIPSIIKKADTFRINFPMYKDHKIFLGFASYGFYEDVEEECIKNGIAIIKQVGDTMVMNEENIKIY